MPHFSLQTIMVFWIMGVCWGILCSFLLSYFLRKVTKLELNEIKTVRSSLIVIWVVWVSIGALRMFRVSLVPSYSLNIGIFLILLSAACFPKRSNPFVNFIYLLFLKVYGVNRFSEKVTRCLSIILCCLFAVHYITKYYYF